MSTTKYLYSIEGNVKFRVHSFFSDPPDNSSPIKDKVEEMFRLLLTVYLFGGDILEFKDEYLDVDITRLNYEEEIKLEEEEDDSAADLQCFLSKELCGFKSGDTRVLGVRVDEGQNIEGEDRLIVTLVLSDPSNGQETWSTDDVTEIERRLDSLISERSPGKPWYVYLMPKHPAELEGEEDGESEFDVFGGVQPRIFGKESTDDL
jgi:hypothetical protein